MVDITVPQTPDDSREVVRSIDENGTLQFSRVAYDDLTFTAQAPEDSRQVARSIDENGAVVFGQVGFEELTFARVFGVKTESTTTHTVSVGRKVFTADTSGIEAGYTVEISSIPDPTYFMYGIVEKKTTDTEPEELTVFVTQVGPVDGIDFSEWSIQVVAGPLISVGTTGGAIFFGTSTSTYSGELPAVFTTQQGKSFARNGYVTAYALDDPTLVFSGIINSYEVSGGDAILTVQPTEVMPAGSSSNWIIISRMPPLYSRATADDTAVDFVKNFNLAFHEYTVSLGALAFAPNFFTDTLIASSDVDTLLNLSSGRDRNRVIYYRVDTGGGDFDITGAFASNFEGQLFLIRNVDPVGTVTIKHRDGSVATEAQWVCPGGADIVMTPDTSVLFRANNTIDDKGWELVASTVPSAGASAGNSFTTIAVAGQSDVVADKSSDTLTLAAGTNITIATDATNDVITITGPDLSGYVPTVRTISVVDPLSGGSDLSADMTIGFVDQAANTVFAGPTTGADDAPAFRALVAADIPINSFSTLAVSGQTNVVADSGSDTLTLKEGNGITITTDATNDVITIAAAATGANTGDQNLFGVVAVSGQSSVVADGTNDTLTLIAGSGVALTTDSTNDTVTITNNGSLVAFKTLSVSGQSDVVADAAADTLTLIAGSGVALTTDATNDTITITNNGSLLAFKTISVSGQSDVVADAAADTLTLAAGTNITLTTDATNDVITITGPSDKNIFGIIAVSGQSNVVADSTNDTLTLIAGTNITLTTDATNDTITITGPATTGTNTGDQLIFKTIAVSGQSDVVADTTSDTLTLVAGSNVTITTDATNDKVTIAASGSSGNSFTTIAVSGQSDVVADNSTDTLTLVAGTNITLTTDATNDKVTITGGTIPVAASQATLETATDTTDFVTAGRQQYHPGHAKAFYSATVTPTAVSGSNSSTNTATEVATWSTTHGLTTGDTIIPVTSALGGLTNLAPYYVNALSTTTLAFYTTLADALADTNRVNLTSNAAMTMRKLVYTNVVTFGMSSVSPVTGVAAATALGLVFNLGTAMSSAVCGAYLFVSNIFDALTTVTQNGVGFPTTIAAKAITYAQSGGWALFETSGNGSPGSWNSQATTAFKVTFAAWGDQ